MFDDTFVGQQRQKLLAERERVDTDLKRIHFAKEYLDPQDVDELAEASEEQSVKTGEADVFEEELKRIEEALERIDHGQYGFCKHCHNYIEIERLEAEPTAVRCGKCRG